MRFVGCMYRMTWRPKLTAQLSVTSFAACFPRSCGLASAGGAGCVASRVAPTVEHATGSVTCLSLFGCIACLSLSLYFEQPAFLLAEWLYVGVSACASREVGEGLALILSNLIRRFNVVRVFRCIARFAY